MGTGFTLYENFDLFKARTRLDFEDVRFNQKVRDMYTWTDKNGKDHLVITTDFVKEDLRPDFEKTVILLHGDNTKKFLNDMEGKRLVNWDEIVYDPKYTAGFGMLKLGKKNKWFGLRKVPAIWFPVVYKSNSPTPEKKHKIFTSMNHLPSDSFGVISYDSVRDNINIVKGVWYSELENNDN